MQEYIVQPRDSLWKIAKEHGTTVASLAAANELKGTQLHDLSIGQKLLIPDGSNGDPDTLLTLKFRGIDTGQFTPKKIRAEFDGKTHDMALNSGSALKLSIFDHSKGLKVWIETLEKEIILVSETAILPIGVYNAAIDSRKLKVVGNMLPEKGAQESSKSSVKKETTTQAQQADANTVQHQVRTEGGEPVHALATIYTKENLRLEKGNEKYREMIVAAAAKYSMTPQAVAAMIDAEAARKDGAWVERSNEGSDKAQGLGQFFLAAWSAVSKDPQSLLSQDCKGLSGSDLMKKALEAKYAIDGVASYAVININGFEKATGLSVSSLPPEEKAKVAYLLHHEGITGLQRLMALPCSRPPYTDDEATDRLRGQIGAKNSEKLDQLLLQYDSSGVAAYRGWLFGYCDTKINVNHFIVQDPAKLASTPRSAAVIMAQVCGQAPTPKPKPRPAAPAATKNTSSAATPQTQPAVANASPSQANAGSSAAAPSATPVGGGQWVDPLAVCTLRTGHLPSKLQAEFGMTRNNGHKAHQGIDLVAVPGTDILAVANGQVYVAPSPSPDYAYGNTLVLRVGINDLPSDLAELMRKVNPGKNTIGFFYAHLSEFAVSPPYKNPYNVYAGQVIGKSGCTGNAKGMDTVEKGAHLHFEVRLEALLKCAGLANRTDPLPFIKNCTNR